MTKYYMVRTYRNPSEYANNSRVAIGWSDWNFSEYLGNINKLLENISAHYKKLGISSNTLGRAKAQIKRFLSIKKGDVLIVPCYRAFMIGTSMDEFLYDSDSFSIDLANQLKVDFVKDENGSVIEFSRVGKNTALESKLRVPGFTVLSIEHEELIAQIDELRHSKADVSHEAFVRSQEANAKMAFKASLISTLSDYSSTSMKAGGRGFEELIADVFAVDGYETKILPKNIGEDTADADIIALKKSRLSSEFDVAFLIQTKHHSGVSSAGLDQIIRFKEEVEKKGLFEYADYSIKSTNIRYALISSAKYNENSVRIADDNNILLFDSESLAEMLFDIIDDLDEQRYKLGYIKRYEHV